MPQIIPNLTKQSFSDLSPIIEGYYQNGLIYRLSLEGLGKTFLQDYLHLKGDEGFAKVRRLYIENTGSIEEEVADDEESFYNDISTLIFNFDTAPKEPLLHVFQNASSHLKEIDERISKIESNINKIREVKDTKAIQSEIPILTYTLDHNRRAREEIIDFLKEDIYGFALRQSDKLTRNQFLPSIPYNYAFNPARYNVHYPSLISNKFKDLSFRSGNETKEKFETDKAAFNEFLASYINHHDVLNVIKLECYENYFFFIRKSTILEAIAAYEDGKRVLFSSIAMTIIEGIFHDICIALGETENDVLSMGFQQKVNIMEKHLDYNFDHEYYSFKFRLLRNKVAHGLMDAIEASEITDLILLDIHDAVQISRSLQIPFNRKRFFLDQALKEGVKGDFKYLSAYIFMDKTEIPLIYNIEDDELRACALVQSPDFFGFIDKCLALDADKPFGYALVKSVKANSKYADEQTSAKCVERFQSMTIKDMPKLDIDKYIDSLISYQSNW